MMYAPQPVCVRVVGKLACVCMCCEISSCIGMSPLIFFFFSCLHKRRGSMHVFVMSEQERASDHALHNAILLTERLP